ncbi:Phosphoglucomutase, cytoplasmic [Artemisia annua]|uniref:phosphoglucomutase (alpha-D-glucose-1,6-bisphosphate-dependent) n=1 Tax=Artemisia annua TaxID=35608 RepID=A0A2U1LRI3_ARTAN|nr:Phosphoglucomutase, cytoplasmic [Artemisia annua]
MANFTVKRVESAPIEDQKTGTSGLRKKVKVFIQPHYLHNFVQSTFNALSAEKVKGSTLVVSGDGRYYSKDAIQIIIKMAAANGVKSVWVGQNGLLSTPAVSAVQVTVKLMKSIFDFKSMKKLIASPQFSFCYDALHGVAGAYASRIFVEELGAKESSLLNCVPKEDFGGGHPDTNLTYAKELVSRMGLGKNPDSNPPEFGAAADGDANRNVVLGKRFFVTPSDSVSIIAANAVESIPYFSSGLKDNLNGGNLVTVEDIVKQHWAKFGRHYYTRYDYKNVDAGAAKELIAHLVKLQASLSDVNTTIKGIRSDVANVASADEFEYKDPVDGSISKNQGIHYLFEDGSRFVFTLSNTKKIHPRLEETPRMHLLLWWRLL